METKISIHAPAKGATQSLYDLLCVSQISIHAPAKGATINSGQCSCVRSYFNPRSREGSDHFRKIIFRMMPRFQSTLPRRERQKPCHYSHNHMNFNPRSREGSDPIIPFKKLDSTEFQSTLPRRERQLFVAVKVWYPIFQSTLPRRERLEYFDSPTVIPKISIHAPAKGATTMS